MPRIAVLDSIKCPGCGDVIPISETIYNLLAERASAAQVSSLDQASERRTQHFLAPKGALKITNEAN